jgi:hypothetical protein
MNAGAVMAVTGPVSGLTLDPTVLLGMLGADSAADAAQTLISSNF